MTELAILVDRILFWDQIFQEKHAHIDVKYTLMLNYPSDFYCGPICIAAVHLNLWN